MGEVVKRYCNCANCGRELLSLLDRDLATAREKLVSQKIDGRPYCQGCAAVYSRQNDVVRRRSVCEGRRKGHIDWTESGSSFDDIERAYEECGESL